MWWVRALSERKRESTAEVSQCRRAPLVGNSFPHLPNQRGNRKMCRTKPKIFHFFHRLGRIE
jgi:hypothetical protein